eukprot:s2670_g1.t1
MFKDTLWMRFFLMPVSSPKGAKVEDAEDSDADEGVPTKLIPETATWKNKVCFFQISDFVEDRVRVRCLNIVAFSLVYIYFVLVLLQTVPKPAPQVKAVSWRASVRFASPPPASWLSGELGDDLKGLYTGLGAIPNRSQKIFVVNDGRGPMPNVEVEVKVTNFVADGPLRCSKAQMDAMKGTVEARRLQHVCGYDRVQYNKGLTDGSGLISLRNFTIDGPGGLYTLLPSAGGVDAPEEAVMLVSTPVASLEVVDDTLQLGEIGSSQSSRCAADAIPGLLALCRVFQGDS